MAVTAEGLQALLVVQAHDTAADQLRHRRATLPERASLAAVEDRVAAAEQEAAGEAEALGAVARRQRRLEDELATVEAKVASTEAQLYGGSVRALRELQALQEELEALGRRRSDLEDAVLEVLTEREPLDAALAALDDRRLALYGEAAGVRSAIAEAEAALDAELTGEAGARREAAAGIAADLLARYERLRSANQGVGVARLRNGRCDGCHLSLPATELDRIRHEPPDALVHCDHCGRILVRPDGSP